MGISLAGTRHQRKACSPKSAGRHARRVSERICRNGRSRFPASHHQHSIRTKQKPENNVQCALGTLRPRGAVPQGVVDSGCVHTIHKKLGPASLGQFPVERRQDSGCRTLVARGSQSKWDQGQDQVCYVGRVLPWRKVGTVRSQPNFLRHAGWCRREKRAKCRRAGQFQTPKRTDRANSKPGRSRRRIAGNARSTIGLHGWFSGDQARGTRRLALDGLRFRNRQFQHLPLVLLAARGDI
jgi:hypothetical protein